jgi:hypothetical protein
VATGAGAPGVSSTRQLSLVAWHLRFSLSYRDVIGAQAPLGQQLLDVAVRKAQVPPHCQQDDVRLKLPPLE